MKVDYLIVGQGVAGSLLSHFLIKRGQTIAVFDPGKTPNASQTAAGIINPVTGRRIVKSWRIDDLLPFAKKTYRDLEKSLDIAVYFEGNILRAFQNQKQETDWLVKTENESYQKYIDSTEAVDKYNELLFPVFAWGEIRGARLDIPRLVNRYKEHLKVSNRLVEEQFDFNAIEYLEDGIRYKAYEAKKILFCEGYQSQLNPYFSYLPNQAAKGECWIVEIDGPMPESMIKNKVFLVPLTENKYWVGSTYSWFDISKNITEEGQATLKKGLEGLIKRPYKILEKKVGIRPVFKDRRPMVGLHPKYPQLGILNGMGTKGASLSPWWANHFAAFLTGELAQLDEEVNVSRVANLFGQDSPNLPE